MSEVGDEGSEAVGEDGFAGDESEDDGSESIWESIWDWVVGAEDQVNGVDDIADSEESARSSEDEDVGGM